MSEDLCNFKMRGNAVVGPKGQIVIPKEVRDLMDINTGDNLIVLTKEKKGIVLIKADNLNEFMEYVKNHLSLIDKKNKNEC